MTRRPCLAAAADWGELPHGRPVQGAFVVPFQAVGPAAAKKSLRLLFLGCGQDETGMLAPGKRLAGLLKEEGINVAWAGYPGGHVFSVWRNDLHDSVPMLFRK